MHYNLLIWPSLCVRLFLRAFEAAARFALCWLNDPAPNGRHHVSVVPGQLSATNTSDNGSSASCIRVGNVCFQAYVVFGGAIRVLTESYRVL